jgi:biofilm PGA synthesis N-glycosyltransferase PgaC
LLGLAYITFKWQWLVFYAYYFIGVSLVYTIFFIAAAIPMIRRYRERPNEDVHSLLKSDSLPPITFIVPAYNEAKDITMTVRTMLSLSYRYKQIIIVNDGSTDDTLELLIQNFSLLEVPPLFDPKVPTELIKAYYKSDQYPDLLVIDKVNGGKADALNAGLNATKSDVHVCTDADTLIDNEALPYLVRPFLEDPLTLIVSSSICIANGCTFANNRILKYGFPKTMLVGFQVVEYLRGIFLDRMGLNWSKGALVVPGAFGLFKTNIIREIGGYSRDSIVEDMEIVMRLHKYMMDNKRDYHVTFIPDPIAWTEAPETISVLYKQRKRWYVGTSQCMWEYIGMMFNPRYKSIGMIVFPYYMFDKVVSPLVELSAYIVVGIGIYVGALDTYRVVLLGLIGWSFMSILTFLCILIEEFTFRKYPDVYSTLKLMLWTLLDSFTYHFLILAWKLRGLFFSKKQASTWHGTPREGYDKISG